MSLMVTLFAAAADAGHGGGASLHIDWAQVWFTLVEIISVLAMLVGLFFVFAGTLGVLRLPDFFTRIHAAGMTDTMGAELILVGLMLQSGFTQMTLKLLFLGFILLITGPTGTHAVANAAHNAGLKPLLGRYHLPDPTADTETTEEAG